MSADLLDLDSFYSSPPAPQQPQQQQKQQGVQFGQQAQPQPQRPQQSTTSSTDLFDFTSFTSNTTVTSRPAAAAPAAPSAPAQQTQPWPDFQTQSNSNAGGWGDFSAFESAFTSSTPTQKQPQQQLQQQKPQQKQDDDDDGWGDFEVAEPTPTQRSFVLPPQTNKARSSPPPRTRVARASTFDLMSNNLVDVIDMPPGAGLSPIPSPGLPSPGWQQQQQPNRGPSPGLSWQTGNGALKPPPSPGLTSQTGPVPKPQPSPRLRGQMPEVSKKPASSPKPPKKIDSNILFDAEEFELQGGNDDDDDDFGDFETVQTPFPGGNMSPTLDSKPRQQVQQQRQKAQPPPSMDLLSLDDDPLSISQPQPQLQPQQKKPQLSTLSLVAPTSPYPQAPKSPSFQERNPFPGLGLTTPTSADFKKDEKPKSPSPVTAWPSFGQTSPQKPSTNAKKGPSTTAAAKTTKFEDDWGDFEAFADEEPSAIDSSKPPESWDWDAVDGVKSPQEPATTIEAMAQPTPATELAPEARDDAPPPINIPPPSVLLSIFPQLLETANTSLFKPLTGQMPPVKKKILSDPATVTFLKGYLALATVAARVIAGRKLRWHRDKFLSQGMAISAAGAKGMKLAGVDKAQAAREDREAADVVGVWKENVGRLRSAVVTANSALKHEQLRVPELSEAMPVSTAKVVPTAAKACIICGLKRDERVSKVDVDVEDSFGEWWVEHWGHRACKNFWVEHEKQLRQR